MLDLVAGLRLLGSRVVLGYCNHQMLIAAVAKATAICSGTWMNVRSFPPEKFRATYDEERKQKSTWYYCPQALSEYKLPGLDNAQRVGLLSRMVPAADGQFAGALFTGAQPTSVGFGEQDAFRHYLHALRTQAGQSARASFEETVNHHKATLDSAEALIRELRNGGVRGQQRDFLEMRSMRSPPCGVRS